MAADSPARSVLFFNYQQAFTMYEEEMSDLWGVMRRGAFIMRQDSGVRASVAAYLGGSRHRRRERDGRLEIPWLPGHRPG